MAASVLAPAAHGGAPEELAGLFIQGCLPFAGNAAALRQWARQSGLPSVPEQARSAFLHGAPGQAFDGSASGVKLVLVSSDDGICSVVTDNASGPSVIRALEAGFRQAGVSFQLVIDRDDANVAMVHDREYLATKDTRSWRILAATIKGASDGEAMLAAASR